MKKEKRVKVTCYCDKRCMDMVNVYSELSTFWIKAYKTQGLVLTANLCKITMEELDL